MISYSVSVTESHGLPFMCRRKSSFIYGVEDDVRDLAQHLVDCLQRNAGDLVAV